MVTNPYKEERIGENVFRRTFSDLTDSVELKWHQDWEDRTVEFICKNDWMIQIDNELPKPCLGVHHIPRGVWHRIIKGTGDLEVLVTKHSDT